MNNLSNDIVSTTKQRGDDILFCFIAQNTKTLAYELNSNLENKSE